MKKPLSFITLLIISIAIISCKKETLSQSAEPVDPDPILISDSVALDTSAAKINLKLYDDPISGVVPNDFLGFSFEKLILTDTNYFNNSNTPLINLFKNLNNGLIRIGGATVDKIFWSKNKRTSLNTDSVYSSDVDRFKLFTQKVGWKTIWGLNLGTADPSNDIREANYVKPQLNTLLSSFAIGNEPEFFGLRGLRNSAYAYNEYQKEFTNFSNLLRNQVPGFTLSGPENENPVWGISFLNDNFSKINLYSFHYYRMGPAGSKDVTMARLLTLDKWLVYVVQQLKPVAAQYKIPFRFAECNSVYSGGQRGMSNAYASSLWGTEFLFYLAQQGVDGINFHTGGGKEYVYSPINTVGDKIVARPLYYAMFLFHQAAAKQFLKSDLQTQNTNLEAYNFIRQDNKKGVLLLNKDSVNNVSFVINDTHMIKSTAVYELKGPSLTSTAGVTINNTTVDNNTGIFKPNPYLTNLNNGNKSILIQVKAASSVLVIFN